MIKFIEVHGIHGKNEDVYLKENAIYVNVDDIVCIYNVKGKAQLYFKHVIRNNYNYLNVEESYDEVVKMITE